MPRAPGRAARPGASKDNAGLNNCTASQRTLKRARQLEWAARSTKPRKPRYEANEPDDEPAPKKKKQKKSSSGGNKKSSKKRAAAAEPSKGAAMAWPPPAPANIMQYGRGMFDEYYKAQQLVPDTGVLPSSLHAQTSVAQSQHLRQSLIHSVTQSSYASFPVAVIICLGLFHRCQPLCHPVPRPLGDILLVGL